MKKSSMFEKYPDVVEVDDLRKMLGGISRRLAYRLLAEQEIRCIKVGRAYKIPKVCVIEYLMGEVCAASIYHEPNWQIVQKTRGRLPKSVEKSSGISPLGV